MSVTEIIPVGLIYKLTSPAGKIYIGSTRHSIEKRFLKHQYNYRQYLLGKYQPVSSIELFKESDDIKIEQLDMLLECSKEDLFILERKYIELHECVNKYMPYRTEEELLQYQKDYGTHYRSTHKDEQKEYNKQYKIINADILKEKDKAYYEEHKPEILAHQKQYYEENKTEILAKQKKYYDEHQKEIYLKSKEYKAKHIESTKAYMKQYHIDNKDRVKEKQTAYGKVYRELNKDKIKATYICKECNKELKLGGKSRHERSIKHITNAAITAEELIN